MFIHPSSSKNRLDFTPMDEFMSQILEAISEHGARAVRIFPPPAQVLIAFADRVANEVVRTLSPPHPLFQKCSATHVQVGEYIISLLERAREVSTAMFLQATAACFRVSWKMVDVLLQAAEQRKDSEITRTKAEDVMSVPSLPFSPVPHPNHHTATTCSKPTWTNTSMKKSNTSNSYSTTSAKTGIARYIHNPPLILTSSSTFP